MECRGGGRWLAAAAFILAACSVYAGPGYIRFNKTCCVTSVEERASSILCATVFETTGLSSADASIEAHAHGGGLTALRGGRSVLMGKSRAPWSPASGGKKKSLRFHSAASVRFGSMMRAMKIGSQRKRASLRQNDGAHLCL